MNDHCGATVAEDGVAVGAQSDVGSDNGGVSSAVGADDQREVRNVTGGQRAVIVPGAIGIEVRAGGLEVGPFALGELVDVERVFAWRKIFDVELDAHAVRCFGERGGADDLIFRVLDVNDEGLRRRRGGVDDGCRKEQAENCQESFHETSLDRTADRGLWPGFEPESTVKES